MFIIHISLNCLAFCSTIYMLLLDNLCNCFGDVHVYFPWQCRFFQLSGIERQTDRDKARDRCIEGESGTEGGRENNNIGRQS